MQVLYDHQNFSNQKYSGISRYFVELIKNCHLSDAQHSTVFSNNYYLHVEYPNQFKMFFPEMEFKGKLWLLNKINKYYSIKKIQNSDYDVFHPTYYDPYFLNYLRGKPFILTVHDMIHEKYPQYFPKSDQTAENKKILAQKSAKIIAISENTKNDLIKYCDISEGKIQVVYHGNSLNLNDKKQPKLKLPKNYILFVGQRGGYKNYSRFITAVSELLINDRELFVVCVGGGELLESELFHLRELRIENRVLQINLDDESLAFVYSKALAFVFPSIYEGFGFPVLEAFSCRCPLVCSHTSSLPEIADQGAVYFDPLSQISIYNSVKKVIYDDQLKLKLTKIGTKRLELFTWDKTAKATQDIYYQITTMAPMLNETQR